LLPQFSTLSFKSLEELNLLVVSYFPCVVVGVFAHLEVEVFQIHGSCFKFGGPIIVAVVERLGAGSFSLVKHHASIIIYGIVSGN